MTTACIKLDGDCLVDALQHEAMEKLKQAEELTLDFSSAPRIDASAARALEELAEVARRANVPVVLRGVSIDVYKVLTLLKLTRRFSFVS